MRMLKTVSWYKYILAQLIESSAISVITYSNLSAMGYQTFLAV